MKKKSLTAEQQEILAGQEGVLNEAEILTIVSGAIHPSMIAEDTLLLFLQSVNLLYRAGQPLISDSDYDFLFLAELKRRNPEHPYLDRVEEEPTTPGAKTVELPAAMLSTEKAYDLETILRWGKRVEKAAGEIGVNFSQLRFRGTPKLDGFAAYDDGTHLYTRGDGKRGTDITRAFERGLQVGGNNARRGLGAGEIVVNKKYFEERLSVFFDNSRNFQAALIKEKELDTPVKNAVAEGAAVFFPFALLPDWEGSWKEFVGAFDTVVEGLWHAVPYDIDGVVFEVLADELGMVVRDAMGATRHHHRYQIAYKKNTQIAEVRVLRVIPQTSRSGRINPVAEVEPTKLSGAMIRRVTAHHYAMVRDYGIGEGALIQMSRSGEVIPKIEKVLQEAPRDKQILPDACPSCGSELEWEGDYLYCRNSMGCPAQLINSMEHFFKTLGNVDGFGPSSVQKLHDYGVTGVAELYTMDAARFEAAGFGPKQSENMVAQLLRSRTEEIEDWRFLAAFGVNRLGMGNCEKLLSYIKIEDVHKLTEEDIVAHIEGFQEKTAHAIVHGLKEVKPLFDQIFALGFTLSRTPLEGEETEPTERGAQVSVIAGKTVVFTGTMVHGSRGDMEKEAKALGATVGKSITGKTDLLVTGEKVGASKMDKATKLGVQIVSEDEYLALLAS